MGIPDVPRSVELEAVNAALAGLGIDTHGLRCATFLPRRVELEYAVIGEGGKQIRVGDGIARLNVQVAVSSGEG